MKKLVTVTLVLVLTFLIPHQVLARSTTIGTEQKPNLIAPQSFTIQPQTNTSASEPCGGQDPIVIDIYNSFDPIGDLVSALTNYRTHPDLNVSTLNTDRYELCFEFPNGSLLVNNTISIVPIQGETKGLAVYGLNLKPDPGLPAGSPLMEVNFPNAPVALIDMSMNEVTNGLVANGTQLTITDSTIVGNGSGVEGDRCIELSGADNSVITNSSISDCYVAIHVLNSNNTRIGGVSDMTGKNTITNNAMGILVKGGSGYKHGYNLIYGNDRIDDDFLYAVEIVGYPAPDPELFEAITEIVGNNVYALDCKTDPDNPRMTFSRSGGTVQLYLVGLEARQAHQYFMSCDLSSSDVCVFSSFPQGYNYDRENCAIVDQNTDIVAVTGFHTSTHTSELMPPVKLDGEPPVIFAESEGVDVPTAPAEDSSGDEVTLTSGAAGASEGGGGEIVALGAKGGCMGGASLLPNEVASTYAPHLGAWWIIFSIALLASLRFAKVRRLSSERIRRRFSGGRRK